MDEIYTYSRPSDHADESKSTRLLRFLFMLGEDAGAVRSESIDGKIKLKKFNSPILTESVENRLSSSGMFSQDSFHWRFSRRSENTCKIETLNLKILMIGSSACQCSMTSIGQREAFQKDVLQFRTCQELRGEIPAGTLDIPWPRRRKEVVWNSQLHTLRENGIPSPHRW